MRVEEAGSSPSMKKGAHPFPGRWNPAAAVNNERHQAGQIFPASPLFQRIPLILAHQPEQFCTGITLRRPLSHPPRPRRRRKLQIRPVKHGPIQPLKSQLNHPAALVIRHGGACSFSGDREHGINSTRSIPQYFRACSATQTCPSCTGSNEPPKIHSFTVIHQKSETFRSLVRQKPADGNAHHPFLQRQAAEAGNKIRQATVIALRLGNP